MFCSKFACMAAQELIAIRTNPSLQLHRTSSDGESFHQEEAVEAVTWTAVAAVRLACKVQDEACASECGRLLPEKYFGMVFLSKAHEKRLASDGIRTSECLAAHLHRCMLASVPRTRSRGELVRRREQLCDP